MFLHLLLLANGPPPFSAPEPLLGAITPWLPLLLPTGHSPIPKKAKSHIKVTFGFFYPH